MFLPPLEPQTKALRQHSLESAS
ncbi:hypothetical protein LINPERPRIM_LOCUS29626 [Linum perenne]